MRYRIESYRLPRAASRLDRVTLWVWKGWVGLVRPVLAVTIAMVLGHLVVSWLVGAPTDDASFTPYRYLVRWASHPLPPLVSPSPGGEVHGPWVLWWAIAAQLAAATAGAAASVVVLRRSPRPVVVGALGGAAATILHLAFADLWTLEPLGALGTVAVTVSASVDPASIRVFAGSPVQNAIAVVALISPVFLGALAGRMVRLRSERRSRQERG